MTIQIYDDLIYFIRFKNIKLAMDFDICVFLGEIKNNRIELNADIERFLLKKFKINKFDSFTKNLAHIKFLVKYSPILSKFVDLAEFDTIEFTPSSDDVVDNWCNISYVKLNDGKEFLNSCNISYDVSYGGQNIISLKIDSEFLTILKKQKFH